MAITNTEYKNAFIETCDEILARGYRQDKQVRIRLSVKMVGAIHSILLQGTT